MRGKKGAILNEQHHAVGKVIDGDAIDESMGVGTPAQRIKKEYPDKNQRTGDCKKLAHCLTPDQSRKKVEV
jgi:hypothetical protein